LTDFDAYWDEMAYSGQMGDSEAERILSGKPGDGDRSAELLASLVEDLRLVGGIRPPRSTEAAQLATLAATARELPGPMPLAPSPDRKRRRRVMRRTRIALPVLGGALAVILGTAGLAAAGVTLPGPAQDAFNSVGIQLPNQAGGSPSAGGQSDAVHAVIDSTSPQDRGCAFGQQVADAVRKGTPQSSHACGGSDESAGSEEGSGNTGSNDQGGDHPTAGQEFGQGTASTAQSSASQDGQSFGGSTSQAAQSLGDQLSQGSQGGSDAGPTGSATGQERAGAGAGNADGHTP
jgi:hypothetical protein